MDPFTEKLLARTQARKSALAKKREELAGRSPVVTPRRPLVENNSDTSIPSTPKENNHNDTPVKAPKGTPVVVTSTQFAGGTPKSVFFEKYAKQASLKQKECFIELEGVKEALKSTPKKEKSNLANRVSQLVSTTDTCDPKENTINASLVANTESPSVKDRKAMYMKQMQVGTTTTPSKTGFPMPAIKQDKEYEDLVAASFSSRVFPSVKEARASLSGGRFFNDPRCEQTASKTSEKISSPAPTKPPRTTVAPKAINEEKLCEGNNANVVPSKPPRSHSQSETSIAPSKPPRHQATECSAKDPQPTVDCSAKRQAPTLPENNSCNGPQKTTPNKSKATPNKSKTTPNKSKTTVKRCEDEIQNDIPKKKAAHERQAPTPPENNSCNGAQKATPNKSKTTGTVKRCEDEIQNDIPKKKAAHERSSEVENVKAVLVADGYVVSPNKDLVAQQVLSPTALVSGSTPTQECETEGVKRSLKAQKISAISLAEMDVNSHEITFNIDMTEFDEALEDEKESMFHMTYNESIKKVTGQEATNKSNNYDEQEDYETFVPVQPNFKGVHKSGYHSSVSDQYAAMVTPKQAKATATRSYTVHERIQMLLEEAAYQQNIVLQASQAVNTCLALHEGVTTGSPEEVEAERLLKFSTERRTACLDQVQKLKTGHADDDACMDKQPAEDLPCNATLTVSGIKISLDQKLLSSKDSSESCIYSFICIIKNNPKQIYCTKAVTSDEIKNNCITFDDKFEIKNVKPSFKLDISIFMLKTVLPLANTITKHKKKTAIAKKKSYDSTQVVTPGIRHGPVFRTSGFALVASSQINLANIHHGKHKLHPVDEKYVLAGDLKIKIACSPEYSNQAKGFLTIFEDVGGLGDWLRYWCILDRNILQYWKYPDEELVKRPLGYIDLGYCLSDSVTIVPRDICARPHTMQLVLGKPVTSADRETLIAVNAGGKMLIKYMLSADTKADKTTWMHTLNDSLKDWRAWHHNLRSKHQNGQQHINSDVIML